MLLGDRTFLDRAESLNYQKTGVYHVLVVAGLHVGALAFFVAWVGNRLRLPRTASALLVFCALAAYVAVVEQRTPVLRASLMAAVVVIASCFYRRVDLLNSAAVAALILLVTNPANLADSSFQLSFVAIFSISALAAPWVERHPQKYVRALKAWRDITLDRRFEPALVQFRLDVRSAMAVFASHISGRGLTVAEFIAIRTVRYSLWAVEMFAVSFVLHLAMLPLMVRDFHRVSLTGPFANLAAVPLTGLIVPAGLTGLGISLLYLPCGKPFAAFLKLLVGLQNDCVAWFANLPTSNYRIPGPNRWAFLVFVLSLLALAILARYPEIRGGWMRKTAIGLLVFAGLAILTNPFAPQTLKNELDVTVLDVAQGDSIFVVSPRGSTLLIDAGGAFEGFRGREEHQGVDPGEEAVSPYLWSRGFKKIDVVAVTHAHQDHIGGTSAILQNFTVGRVWISRETSAPALEHLKTLAASLNIPVEHRQHGEPFQWDGVQVQFLWPDVLPDTGAPIAKNNDSLVVRLSYGDRSVLLPGDAEKQVEYTMLSEDTNDELHSDVLKIAHHGSKNSSMPQFLEAVAPKVAIISSGDQNPYGHPSPELLDRLKQYSLRVLRTDQDGAVRILTDGHNLELSCFRPCPPGPVN